MMGILDILIKLAPVVTALSTFIGLFLIGGYVFFTYRLFKVAQSQSKELQRSNELTRKDVEFRLRPWLAIEEFMPEAAGDLSKWELRVKNYGLGVAESLAMKLSWTLPGGVMEPFPDGVPSSRLVPGQVRICPVHLDNSQTRALQSGEAPFLKLHLKYEWGTQAEEVTQVWQWNSAANRWSVKSARAKAM